jgi:hypothetical protein
MRARARLRLSSHGRRALTRARLKYILINSDYSVMRDVMTEMRDVLCAGTSRLCLSHIVQAQISMLPFKVLP